MARSFSIVTTCKGRLEHLKLSLPAMLEQGAGEVIVVDYSCPEGTGDYVREHFPAVRVVTVENESHFSNWKARNAGAAVVKTDFVVFCDADVVLKRDVVEGVVATLPERSFGTFRGFAPDRLRRPGSRLSANQLKGFQIVPAAAFRSVEGYDEVLEGYASGADTDLQARLKLAGIEPFDLDPKIVARTIDHSDADRLQHHRQGIRISYGAGLLYRSAKTIVLQLTGELEASLETRQKIYANALERARRLASDNSTAISVRFVEEPVLMPRVLGFDAAVRRISLKVELVGRKKSAKPKG